MKLLLLLLLTVASCTTITKESVTTSVTLLGESKRTNFSRTNISTRHTLNPQKKGKESEQESNIEEQKIIEPWQPLGSVGFSRGAIASPVLRQGKDGSLYAAYIDFEQGENVVVRKFDGVIWTSLGVEASDERSSACDLQVGLNGVYVMYTAVADNTPTWVLRYDGDSWLRLGTESATEKSAQSKLLLDSENTPYVIYSDLSENSRLSLKKFDGMKWEVVGEKGFTKRAVNDFDAIFTASGLFVAFVDEENDNKISVLYYDGESWGALGDRGFSEGKVSGVRIYASSSQEIFVAFKETVNIVADQYEDGITAMRYDGMIWSDLALKRFIRGKVRNPDIAALNGSVYAVYENAALFENVSFQYFRDGRWNALSGGIPPGRMSNPRIVLGGDTNLFILYRDVTNAYKASVLKCELP